jgi:putative FmdB family regulatory protein
VLARKTLTVPACDLGKRLGRGACLYEFIRQQQAARHQRTAGHFNLLPLPPLDGGRIAVGVLPDALANPLARLEPYGLMILIGVLFILPLLGAQLGIDLNFVWHLVQRATNLIIDAILCLTGNAVLGERLNIEMPKSRPEASPPAALEHSSQIRSGPEVFAPDRVCWSRAMPTYSYRCEKCGTTFERTETISEHETARPQCPKCGSKNVSAIPGRIYVVTSKKS